MDPRRFSIQSLATKAKTLMTSTTSAASPTQQNVSHFLTHLLTDIVKLQHLLIAQYRHQLTVRFRCDVTHLCLITPVPPQSGRGSDAGL